MKLKILDNNIVNFESFYVYNYMNITSIKKENTLVLASNQFGVSEKMLMSYPSKVYVVSLYHGGSKNNENPKKFVPSSSFITIEDIEKVKKTSMNKIDYIVIAEKEDTTEEEIKDLVNNILFVSKKSDNVTYRIHTTEAKAMYSSLDSLREDHKTVEFTFYKEVLDKDKFANAEKEAAEDTKKKKEVIVKPTKGYLLYKWILCNNNLFYNTLSILLVIAIASLLVPEVQKRGLEQCYYAIALFSIPTIMVLIALQYTRIDINKRAKHKK